MSNLRHRRRKDLGAYLDGLRNYAGKRIMQFFCRFIMRREVAAIRLGSAYGGWWIPSQILESDVRLAYSAGAGEDITFDVALAEHGIRVVLFDPTPRAAEHFEAHSYPGLEFVPEGWWRRSELVKFYAPIDQKHVSHSIGNYRGTAASFVAQVRPIHEFMAIRNDCNVEIVKMDIEGAELSVLASMRRAQFWPQVLLVEFDNTRNPCKVLYELSKLRGAGYRCAMVENRNVTLYLEQSMLGSSQLRA